LAVGCKLSSILTVYIDSAIGTYRSLAFSLFAMLRATIVAASRFRFGAFAATHLKSATHQTGCSVAFPRALRSTATSGSAAAAAGRKASPPSAGILLKHITSDEFTTVCSRIEAACAQHKFGVINSVDLQVGFVLLSITHRTIQDISTD
jgi:hypothetical protein